MRRFLWRAACLVAGLVSASLAHASDHLDTPTVIADPRADIADVYAWMARDGRHLNLVMTIVGKTFSDRLDYVFHVDSGRRIGRTSATVSITCRFPDAEQTQCRAGTADEARGDARSPAGLAGRNGRFRVFAGLRDDPFFNNVKGARAAYKVAAAALKTAPTDAAGCPAFDRATAQSILKQWRHTDGGPAANFLAGWVVSAIVITVDLDVVNKGGALLGVWGATVDNGKQIDRAARTLTGNALLGTVASDEESDRLKERYNAATPAEGAQFVPEIEKGLALYDAFDGVCGNQMLASGTHRYRALATLLADDRLWVNSASSVCLHPFAVERARLGGETRLRRDCGGRTPKSDAANVWRALLVNGTDHGFDDGLQHDDRLHSVTAFPFLAAPDAPAVPE